jgi:hypothetical protein
MSEAGTPIPAHALSELWGLAQLARQAGSAQELGFLLVNQTLSIQPYRQAVLWLQAEDTFALSGVVQIEANAPYVSWVNQVSRHLSVDSVTHPRSLTARDLPDTLAQEWAAWWPEHALWIPDGVNDPSKPTRGGSLWVRETIWEEDDVTRMEAWSQVWWHAFRAVHRPRLHSWTALKERTRQWFKPEPDQAWYQQRRHRLAMLMLTVLLFPIRLSVLAPGELVPAHPVVIRSPLEAVIDTFYVQPNQLVAKDQPLFGFDQALIQSRLEVAQQMLTTAQTDYRQTYQLALMDAKSKSQLALLAGKIEERRAELVFAKEQQLRATVVAPQAGMVLMDDPGEWIGKPLAVGERILRIATPGDVEVEAWIPIGDAIELPPDASLNLYLNASPLSPVSARIRYLAHDAVQRPDGVYAYRLRGTLTESTEHRVGLKGTVRVQGPWVPLGFAMLRRPLAALRTYLGV